MHQIITVVAKCAKQKIFVDMQNKKRSSTSLFRKERYKPASNSKKLWHDSGNNAKRISARF